MGVDPSLPKASPLELEVKLPPENVRHALQETLFKALHLEPDNGWFSFLLPPEYKKAKEAGSFGETPAMSIEWMNSPATKLLINLNPGMVLPAQGSQTESMIQFTGGQGRAFQKAFSQACEERPGRMEFIDENGVCVELLLYYSDERVIGSIRELQGVYEDPLTGLGNVRAMQTFFKELDFGGLENEVKTSNEVAMIMLDVDRFKIINDTLGHQVGDNILKILALLLKSSVRGGTADATGSDKKIIEDLRHSSNPGIVNVSNRLSEWLSIGSEADKGERRKDLVARPGGDEFIVLLGKINQIGVENVVDRIRSKLTEINSLLEEGYKISLSIGAVISDGSQNIKTMEYSHQNSNVKIEDQSVPLVNIISLQRYADELMYRMKHTKPTPADL